MPAQASGHIRKYLRKRKMKKAAVLRVLAAVMENQAAAASNAPGGDNPNSDYHNEFFNTGRIGRRNALPDILGYNCTTTTTADLPLRLSALTTSDTPSTSSVSNSSSSAGSSSMDAGSDPNVASTSSSCSSSTQPIQATNFDIKWGCVRIQCDQVCIYAMRVMKFKILVQLWWQTSAFFQRVNSADVQLQFLHAVFDMQR
ncbi:uncharacterized protein LOC119659947 isoform X2 [Hermetia illucens]|uniref:uncharacterized protein LOC119659947 isoform X2 n=1 Tax=Hermetia illucens TaxID=343691 RepID=UPI0018CC56BE|nr:uncharacterized protein LOC119659947 isoform X2 [Hermetia illucens]